MTSLKKNQNGYALLVSVVVIATVLMMLATVSARRVQDEFLATLNLHQSLQVQALAQGCAQEALLKRSSDSQYAGDEVITIQDESCMIFPLVGQTIDVQASAEEKYYRIHIELTNDEPPSIARWERVATF